MSLPTPRVILSAALFTALVVAASQSFAESFRVMSEYNQTVVARCSGDSWTDVAYRDSLDFDCSGDSLEVAADTDGTDSVTITWSCGASEYTSPGGITYQRIQDVRIVAHEKGYAGFSIAQSGTGNNCTMKGSGTSTDQ